MNGTQRRLYSLPDVGEQLGGLKRTKVFDLIKQGHLSTVKIGSRTFVSADSLDRYVATLTGETSEALDASDR